MRAARARRGPCGGFGGLAASVEEVRLAGVQKVVRELPHAACCDNGADRTILKEDRKGMHHLIEVLD